MAYNRNQVRSLLNASELELFESSLATQVKALSERQVRSKLGRARTLRDKFRDLLRRQKLATRGRTGSKLGNSGAANERTQRKASVMAEVLERFETRARELDVAQKADAAAAKKTAAKKTAAKKTAAKKTAAKRDATSKTAASTAAKKTTAKKTTAKKTTAKKTTAKKAAVKKARPAAVVLREALEKKRASGNSGAPMIEPPVSDKAPSKAPQGSNAAVEPSPGRKAPRIWESGLQRIEGHIGTQVRRAQGKRDSRG